MLGHLIGLSRIGEVTAVADFAPGDAAPAWPAEIARVAIRVARPISPWADLLALLALYRLFRARREVVDALVREGFAADLGRRFECAAND